MADTLAHHFRVEAVAPGRRRLVSGAHGRPRGRGAERRRSCRPGPGSFGLADPRPYGCRGRYLVSSASAAAAAAPMADAAIRPSPTVRHTRTPSRPPATVSTDLDLGLQTRSYGRTGIDGQGRFEPSRVGRVSSTTGPGTTTAPALPSRRSAARRRGRQAHPRGLRELFISRVGTDWEVHAGFRQIFWGVTEFEHLVDIINQTDLVENIDGEDKLGQPMVQLSLVRDWGIVDIFALTGFRERTFPGEHGRLRSVLPVDTHHARYESGAGRHRVDAAIRWSDHMGPLNFGIYHFSGTSRDPSFVDRDARRQAGAGARVRRHRPDRIRWPGHLRRLGMEARSHHPQRPGRPPATATMPTTPASNAPWWGCSAPAATSGW